jgi:hypothetical protein
MTICPVCNEDYNPEATAPHTCKMFHSRPITMEVLHPEWAIDIKLSDDNTKGEKRATVHVRSDGDPQKALELANKLFLGAFKE